MGAGGQGKTCTIKALLGQEFDEAEQSTPGTSAQTVEVERQQAHLGAGGKPLRRHSAREGGQVEEAIAAYAVQLDHEAKGGAKEDQRRGAQQDAGTPPAGGPVRSPLDDARRKCQQLQQDAGTPPAGQQARSVASGRSSRSAPPQQTRSAAAASSRAAISDDQKNTIMKMAQKAETEPSIMVSIFDCGGQDEFRDMHDVLHSNQSAFMVVFSAADAADSGKQASCLSAVRDQLDAIFVHAMDAKIILVGTRSGAMTDEQLSSAEDNLEDAIRDCPCFKNVVPRQGGAGPRRFFPVENSRGFDGRHQELAAAIERAAASLESSQMMVPVAWLQIFDKARARVSQYTTVDEMRDLAIECGLPHAGLTLEVEMEHFLQLFHNLGCLFWFADPGLRTTVILDPQWILDGITCIVRTYGLHKKDRDDDIHRQFPREWRSLQEGRLQKNLLPYLWYEDRFKGCQDALLSLMLKFGFLVELKGRTEYLVPSLLSGGSLGHHAQGEGKSFIMHFGLKGAKHPDLVWQETDLQRGFMPLGVYRQLCGACIGWTYHTTKGFEPRMTANEASVSFGRSSLFLRQNRTGPFIEVIVRGGARMDGIAVAERLQLLVADVLGAHYANLDLNMLLPMEGAIYVHREELLHIGAEQTIKLNNQDWTLEELRQQQSFWLEPSGLPDVYHTFLSYRWGPYDSRFVDRVADCLRAKMIADEPLRVFQDKRRLREGEQLDIAFMRAARRSLVIAPVVSWDALERMRSLSADSGCDNVLLEWSLALVLNEVHDVQVIPLFVGHAKDDGSMNAFFAGPKVKPDAPATTGSPDMQIPDVVVSSVIDRLSTFAEREGIGLPQCARTRSAREVVKLMLKFLGVMVHELADSKETAWDMHESVASRIFDVISRQWQARLSGPAAQEDIGQAAGDGPSAEKNVSVSQPAVRLEERAASRPPQDSTGDFTMQTAQQDMRLDSQGRAMEILSQAVASLAGSQERIAESQARALAQIAASQESALAKMAQMQNESLSQQREMQRDQAATLAAVVKQMAESQERTLAHIAAGQERTLAHIVAGQERTHAQIAAGQERMAESQERALSQMAQMLKETSTQSVATLETIPEHPSSVSTTASARPVQNGCFEVTKSTLTVFESPESTTRCGVLRKGDLVSASGPVQHVKGYAMQPINPKGAVEGQFLRRVDMAATLSGGGQRRHTVDPSGQRQP